MVTSGNISDSSKAPSASGEGNSYEFNARGVLQLYGDFIEGTPNCTLAVLSKGPLSAEARAAFQASAERLGYGKDACAWIVLESDAGQLGPSDVLSVLEGLDPRGVVAADAHAASCVSGAYSVPFKLDAANRAGCRTVVALSDFEGALHDDDAKRKAWAALKKLSR